MIRTRLLVLLMPLQANFHTHHTQAVPEKSKAAGQSEPIGTGVLDFVADAVDIGLMVDT